MLTNEAIKPVVSARDGMRQSPLIEKRVLAVVRWPLGGIRTHILYTYPTLISSNYRFTFVGPDNAAFQNFADSLSHFSGSEFISVPTSGSRCPLWRTVAQLISDRRFGMIHSHGMTAGVNSVLGNVWRGLPHLLTVHGVFYPNEFYGIKGWLKKWALTQVLRRTSRVVGVSEDVCHQIKEFLPGINTSRSHLMAISNRIDISQTVDLECSLRFLRNQLELPSETLLLGYLGRFMEEKGFGILLRALDELKCKGINRPIHLVAIGSGDCRKQYQQEILERGLNDQITILDYTPNVLPYLRQFDLLVVPSLQEASSLVSMEAMAVGVPVLGANCIGLREVLRDTPSRVFCSGDPQSLADELRKAASNLWTASAMDFAPKARERFDSRQSGREFLGVFDALYQNRCRTS